MRRAGMSGSLRSYKYPYRNSAVSDFLLRCYSIPHWSFAGVSDFRRCYRNRHMKSVAAGNLRNSCCLPRNTAVTSDPLRCRLHPKQGFRGSACDVQNPDRMRSALRMTDSYEQDSRTFHRTRHLEPARFRNDSNTWYSPFLRASFCSRH